MSNEKREDSAARVLELITHKALLLNASDIHIERREKSISLRFRVDGMLREMTGPPFLLHDALISCIKVLSHLRTDVHNVPQDGRYTIVHQSKPIDIRASIVPAYFGEKAVLRLLAKPLNRQSLADLGFSEEARHIVERAISRPSGLVLVVGPTGSGKTTTLYEMLQIVSSKAVSVVSLEDPIEYALEKLTQIPVHQKNGFTFANALRAVLRQDPDIIMVGEIRDAETAELAASAALTGHLVLSTLHATDSINALSRLFSMKVPDYLIAPSLSLVVSQRLLRCVCPHCKEQVKVPEWFHKTYSQKLEYETKGKGCEKCFQTGYRGRTVIYELLEVDEDVKRLLSNDVSPEKMASELKNIKWKSLFDSGMNSVKNGITTCEELFRVLSA